MEDNKYCPADKMDTIATEMNLGHRDNAMAAMNDCTMNLLKDSDYGQILSQSPIDMPAAEKSFGALAMAEQKLWSQMSNAAQAKGGADSLCQLTIVVTPNNGPHAELDGKFCK